MSKRTDRFRCSASVWRDTWHRGTCQRHGTVERDGKWYCKQHDPEVAKAKLAAAKEAAEIRRRAADAATEEAKGRIRAMGCGSLRYHQGDPGDGYSILLSPEECDALIARLTPAAP